MWFLFGFLAGCCLTGGVAALWFRSTLAYWRGRMADKDTEVLAREVIAFHDGQKNILAKYGRPDEYH